MIHKAGVPITSLDEWAARGGPKRQMQWKAGYSAMEAARCWAELQGPALPPEVSAAVSAHPDFGDILEWSGEPESQVRFDRHNGPANIDLLIRARDAHGAFVLALEAKVGETFGATVAQSLAASLETKVRNPRSKKLDRMDQLVRALLFPRGRGLPALETLRYQLLTATAAALAEAKRQGADRAVLLVHEFRTNRTTAKHRKENHADLTAFVRRISRGAVRSVEEGRLYGPFQVPGAPLFHEPAGLYVGKVGREVA